MKYIYYDIKNTVNLGTENDPHIEDIIRTVRIRYSENNLIFAQEESYNGEYRIEDDGIEEVIELTPEERITILEEQNAALEEQNMMLLECVLEMSEIIYA